MARTDSTTQPPSVNRWIKPRLSLARLLGVLAVAGGLIFVWHALLRSAVRIDQVATPEEPISNCFTVGCDGGAKTCKPVLRVVGRLSSRDWVEATLYSMHEGTVQKVSSISTTVPSRPTSDFLACDFDVRFALCERDDPTGPVLLLGVAGRKSAAGSGSFLSARRRATNVRVFPGPVPGGHAIIAYVRGGRASCAADNDAPSIHGE